MILYIIRHAWAEDADESRWPDDFDRPLTSEGQKRFAKMVRLLAEREFAPQAVATSPLVRCRQTAEIVVRGLADRQAEPRLAGLDALAPGSDLASLLAWTEREAADCDEVAWVGHAPDVSHLTAALIGSPQGWIRFAKGAVASIEFDDSPAPGGGELRWLTTAKLLGC
jgi:phosphohistidine phosphatase